MNSRGRIPWKACAEATHRKFRRSKFSWVVTAGGRLGRRLGPEAERFDSAVRKMFTVFKRRRAEGRSEVEPSAGADEAGEG